MPGSRYTSGRGAALGDAFIPLADDGAGSLFYNPAGIGKIRYTQVEPLNFQLQLNSDYLKMFDRTFYKVTSLSSYAPSLLAKPGLFPGVAGGVFPNFAFRGFAMGILMQDQFTGTSDGSSSITYRSSYQFIPTFGGGVRLFSGVVRVGYSLQWVNQASGTITVPAGSDPLGYNQQLNQGAAISHNLGVAVTLPVAYLPAFNIVGRNLLGAKYYTYTIIPLAQNKSTTVPDTDKMSFDASFSMQPKIGKGGYFNLVLELRDATNTSGVSLLGRAAAGVEFSFRDQFFLRGGWGSGYPCAGIGLKRKAAEFSLAWYSEEFGTGYHQQQDTRWMLHYQIRAF